MIKLLLQRAIEQDNPFLPKDLLQLQIELFTVAGKITSEDRAELLALMGVEVEQEAGA